MIFKDCPGIAQVDWLKHGRFSAAILDMVDRMGSEEGLVAILDYTGEATEAVVVAIEGVESSGGIPKI